MVAMRFLQSMLLLGGAGLVLGAALGAAVPTWKKRLLLTGLGGLALLYGLKHLPRGSVDSDDAGVLAMLALAANFGGWVIGLAIGGAVARVRR
jgi:hypothetical protein